MWYFKELYHKYKAYQVSKSLDRSLEDVMKILGKHVFLGEEVVYPKLKVYSACASRLLIIKTEKSIRVTQVPCSPLKFVPSNE